MLASGWTVMKAQDITIEYPRKSTTKWLCCSDFTVSLYHLSILLCCVSQPSLTKNLTCLTAVFSSYQAKLFSSNM